MNVLKVASTRTAFLEEEIRHLEKIGVRTHVVYAFDNISKRRGLLDRASVIKSIYKKVNDFDIVHANDAYMAPIALAQNKAPAVTSFIGNEANGRFFSYICPAIKHLSDRSICVNNKIDKMLGGDNDVIPYGVDTNKFEPMPKSKACRKIGWNSSIKHVLFPYDPDRTIKRPELAQKVVREVNRKCNTVVKLQTVYGVPLHEVPIYMNAADLLLITSSRETGPVTVKEALACNTPVVSTNVGDVSEVLSGVQCSAIADNYTDMIASSLELIKANNHCNSRPRACRWEWDNLAQKIKETYKKVLE
ncbi:glycosyltransferase [Salinibacter ruber]|uniref:glycosyltransferase n=1 Tax=Salinibacter ruber TaxID=146919 RepID=UPI0021677B91|nr:glycosyltransferase [Salinibacter ruber]MCS3683886.1 glycosyltransferase involved in cell wall biosynthesis [Salinibacter ruber]